MEVRLQMNRPIFCLISILSYLALTALIYCWHAYSVPVLNQSSEATRLSDFGYYLAFVRAYWFSDIDSIYSSQSYATVLREFIKTSEEPLTMPLALSPSALVLWYPFACVSYLSFELAQSLWTAFSLQILLTQLLLMGSSDTIRTARGRFLYYLIAIVCFSSFTFVSALALGQTSIFASGALLFIFRKNFSGQRIEGNGLEIASIFLLVCLSIKPQYFIIGFIPLLFNAKPGFLIAVVSLTALTMLAGDGGQGLAWLPDYLENVAVFSSRDIPVAYAHAFRPEGMNLFASAFSPYWGTESIVRISNLLFFAAYGAVSLLACLAFVLRLRAKPLDIYAKWNICPNSLALMSFLILLGAYLLFAPYAGRYEDMLLLSAAFTYLWWRGNVAMSVALGLFLAIVLCVLLNFYLLLWLSPLVIFWLLKTIFFCYLWYDVSSCLFRTTREPQCSTTVL